MGKININFNEPEIRYTEEEAKLESKRCLLCKNPLCESGCPLNVKISEFIKFIRDGDYFSAYKKIKENNCMPSICSRICAQENLCENSCVLKRISKPIEIGKLEKFIGDKYIHINENNSNYNETNINDNSDINNRPNLKICIIGSGPASLATAMELFKKNFTVTIYESENILGGILSYGIPEFRLPRIILNNYIEFIKRSKNITIIKNCYIGKNKTIDSLLNEFDAVVIACGMNLPKKIGIPGEDLFGVYTSNKYLYDINLNIKKLPKMKDVIIIGGGDVAIDAARSALRAGAKTSTIIYRKRMQDMPARKTEINHALIEGVKILELVSPKKINGDKENNIVNIECQKSYIIERGDNHLPNEKIETKEYKNLLKIKCDFIITAIGSAFNSLILKNTNDIEINDDGLIKTDDYFRTSKKKLYAIGDVSLGPMNVASAIRSAKIVSNTIMKDTSSNKKS